MVHQVGASAEERAPSAPLPDCGAAVGRWVPPEPRLSCFSCMARPECSSCSFSPGTWRAEVVAARATQVDMKNVVARGTQGSWLRLQLVVRSRTQASAKRVRHI